MYVNTDVSVFQILKDGEMAKWGSSMEMLYHPRLLGVCLVPPAYLVNTTMLLYQMIKLKVLG